MDESHSKLIFWLGGEVKTPPFSLEARLEAGFLLRKLQEGENLSLPASRPMSSIGSQCHELRITDEGKEWRIIYCIDADAVVILDVFKKTTPKTPITVIKNCKRGCNDIAKFEYQNLGDLFMELEKRQRLEAEGWNAGTAADFLGLSKEEAAFVELKLVLSKRLKEHRNDRRLTQTDLARRLNSSQSRVAKMEAGDPSVSTDLLIRALLFTGATPKDVAEAIAQVNFSLSPTVAQDLDQPSIHDERVLVATN